MGDVIGVTPITVCLSLFGTTVLTWCFGKDLILSISNYYSGKSENDRFMA